MILFEASELDVLCSEVSPWGESLVKPTNFHDLQLTFHLVIVTVLFKLLFEVTNLGGLQRFASDDI